MAVFPKVQRQCPWKDRRAAAMDGDICRICDHQVIDLSTWSDEERIAFAAGQKEAVCISYRVPLRPALAAAALAAAGVPSMAAAQDAAAPPAAEAPARGPEFSEFVGIISRPRPPDPLPLTVFDAAREPGQELADIVLVTADELLAAIAEAPPADEDERPARTRAKPKS